jgi:zinc protease
MFAIKKKYYIPNNSLLIIAGDIETDDVKDLVPEYFDSWEAGPDPFTTEKTPEIEPMLGNKFVTDFVEQPTSVVFVRWHGPSIGIDDKATYAADVFSEIIKQDEHEFTKALLESGIANGRNFWYYTQRLVGPIQGDIYATPEKLKQAMDIFWKQVKKFTQKNYYTDEQLETSKSQLRSRIIYDTESLSDFTKTVAFWWASTGLDYYEGYLDELQKVNRKDINDYLKKYVIGKPYVLGLATNLASFSKYGLDPKSLSHDNFIQNW